MPCAAPCYNSPMKKTYMLAVYLCGGIVFLEAGVLLVFYFYAPQFLAFQSNIPHQSQKKLFPEKLTTVSIEPNVLMPLDWRFDTALELLPPEPEAGKQTVLRWKILETKTGAPIILKRAIHGIPLHIYLAEENLSEPLIHLHPRRESAGGKEGWLDSATFPSGGKWFLVSEFAKEETMYRLESVLQVKGNAKMPPRHNQTKVAEDNLWRVTFETKPSTPQEKTPTLFTFTLSKKSAGGEWRTRSVKRSESNVLLVPQGDAEIFNVHGDKSTDRVLTERGVLIRPPRNDFPSPFEIAFPHRGLWLIQVEFFKATTSTFFINVE